MSDSISWYVCVRNILDAYQVQQLRRVGVSAIHAVCTGQCRDVSMGKYRFGGSMRKILFNFVVRRCIHYNNDTVFMSPETVQLKAWRDVFSCTLVKERLVCVAIDEAHCIAEWSVGKFLCIKVFYWNIYRGSDFRTAFHKLGGLRSLIDAPFMALSASAPSQVQETIIETLCLRSPDIVSCDLNRANIFLSVSSILSLAVSVHYCTK